MNITIAGPGAIGCLFAFRFAEAGHSVSLLDHNRERADRIDRHGLLIDNGGETRNLRVEASASPESLPTPDIVCVCVKAYDTKAAVHHASSLISKANIAVSIQNGAGNAEHIFALAPHHTVCATTSMGATLRDSGHIVWAGDGPTEVAPFSTDSIHGAQQFTSLLRTAGIQASYMDDAPRMLWGKLIINAAINPITALWGVSNGEAAKRDDLRSMLVSAATEAEAVAKAAGIRLPYRNAARKAEEVCRNTAANFSSMLQDVRNGRRTEIREITGVIVKNADRLAIDVPVNRMLLRRIEEISTQ